MEPEGIRRMFLMSEEINHLQYTRYIRDWGSKSFSSIVSLEPYQGKTFKKYEFVGQFQKQMETGLRKVKFQFFAKRLEDGKSIRGNGRLRTERIDRL